MNAGADYDQLTGSIGVDITAQPLIQGPASYVVEKSPFGATSQSLTGIGRLWWSIMKAS